MSIGFNNIELLFDYNTLTNIQLKELELVDNLTSNINSIRPSNFIKNKLSFDGKVFSIIQHGFRSNFLISDITETIKNNEENHKKFILKTIQKEFNELDVDSKFTKKSDSNSKFILESIIKYYRLNTELSFPNYLNSLDFKNYIDVLEEKITKEFS